MDQFDKGIEALKQDIYKAGYVDAYFDIYDAVKELTELEGRQLYRAIDRLFNDVQFVIVKDGK